MCDYVLKIKMVCVESSSLSKNVIKILQFFVSTRVFEFGRVEYQVDYKRGKNPKNAIGGMLLQFN